MAHVQTKTQAVDGRLVKSVWEQVVVCKTAILLYEQPSFSPSACQLMLDRLTQGRYKPFIQLTGHVFCHRVCHNGATETHRLQVRANGITS